MAKGSPLPHGKRPPEHHKSKGAKRQKHPPPTPSPSSAVPTSTPEAPKPKLLSALHAKGQRSTPALEADPGAPPTPSPPPAVPTSAPEAPKPKLLSALHTKGQRYTPALQADRAFDADPKDHCETPFIAYRDIEPFLFRIALSLKRSKAALRIYDPYFCEGSVVKHLNTLGFESVYNQNEDFYEQIAQGTVPEHDVVVTNPPFSADHIERALHFCVTQNKGRPWMLLLPSFIYKKQTCAPELARGPSPPIFLVPASTYTFWSPGRNFRTGPARAREPAPGELPAGKTTMPFECMWYIWTGPADEHAELKRWWLKKYERASGCVLATSPAELPEKAKPKRVEKRPNPKARKRMRAKGIAI
jgi:hypothetical protein